MDTLLLGVTILSLVVALASILAVRRMKHGDQQRSDARVAALSAAAIGDSASFDSGRSAVIDRPSPVAEHQWSIADHPVRFDNRPSTIDARRSTAHDHDVTIDDGSFFGTVQREKPADGRFAFVAAAALIVALGGAIVVFTTSGHGNTTRASAARVLPLELVSLGHSREDSGLTITGMVRNPQGGATLEGLTAVVSLIDNYGGLISTKDVPLDYRALGPGEEAPFKVTVPDSGSVARYRVSFRAGADVIPHVDRRSDAKLASAL